MELKQNPAAAPGRGPRMDRGPLPPDVLCPPPPVAFTEEGPAARVRSRFGLQAAAHSAHLDPRDLTRRGGQGSARAVAGRADRSLPSRTSQMPRAGPAVNEGVTVSAATPSRPDVLRLRGRGGVPWSSTPWGRTRVTVTETARCSCGALASWDR